MCVCVCVCVCVAARLRLVNSVFTKKNYDSNIVSYCKFRISALKLFLNPADYS